MAMVISTSSVHKVASFSSKRNVLQLHAHSGSSSRQTGVVPGLPTRQAQWPSLRYRGRRPRHVARSGAVGQVSAFTIPSARTEPVNVEQQRSVDGQQWRRCGVTLITSLVCVASVHVALMVCPGVAHASSGALSASALDAFKQWLQYVDSLGSWGPVLFVGTVVLAEMVPLFPTQPIALASGLLFGPVKGTFLVLLGVTVAAINAFLISRGVGKSLAKKVIEAEVGESGHGQGGGILQSKLAEVQAAIASGSFAQQFGSVLLLRLTPVVPYSASNYILGLTPLQFSPFVLGTALGMTVWSILYASIGGASRALLTSGVSISVIFSDLAERASGYTSNIAVAALGVVAVIVGFWAINTFVFKDKSPKSDETNPVSEGEEQTTEPVEQVREKVSTPTQK